MGIIFIFSIHFQKPIGWNFATAARLISMHSTTRFVAISDNDVCLTHSLCIHTIVNLYFDRHFLSTRTYFCHALSFSRTLILPTTLQITKHSDGEFVPSQGNIMSVIYIQSSSFSAGGTNMLFESNHIQNGDDCLTVGNGAKNIHFRSVPGTQKRDGGYLILTWCLQKFLLRRKSWIVYWLSW